MDLLHLEGMAPREGGFVGDGVGAAFAQSAASSSGSSSSSPDAIVTPAKLSVALLLREFCFVVRCPDRPASPAPAAAGEGETTGPVERKQFCLLMLGLIQDPDLSLAGLARRVSDSAFRLPAGMLGAWRRCLEVIPGEDVHGLLDLVKSLRDLVDPEKPMPFLHRSAYLGQYLRRLVLHFDKLSFSEVSPLLPQLPPLPGGRPGRAAQARKSGRRRWRHDRRPGGEIDSVSFRTTVGETHVALFPGELVQPGSGHRDAVNGQGRRRRDDAARPCRRGEGRRRPPAGAHAPPGRAVHRPAGEAVVNEGAPPTRLSQVSLLQSCEPRAESPAAVEAAVRRILERDREFSEAYFLAYLNCLRTNDYTGAMHNLTLSVSPEQQQQPGQGGHGTKAPLREELNKGFR